MEAMRVQTRTIPRIEVDGPRPLSSPQERLFLLDRIMPGLGVYNVPTLVRVGATLDADLLRAAFDAVVARHEILRTSMRLIDGEPMQEVRPGGEVDLLVADLRTEPEHDRPQKADQILAELAVRPFDLGGDVLLRAGLVHIDHEEDLLLVVFHHTASDHMSSTVLFTELDRLYWALEAGEDAVLPDLPIQYSDYAQWQRDQLTGPYLEELLDYWTKRLAGAPERLELPTDRPRPAMQSYRGRTYEFAFRPDVAERLRWLARDQRVSLFMVLLAAFKTLLFRYTSVEDLVVGVPVSGRHQDELAPLVGYFSNTLALRTDLSGDPTFAELLQQVRETTLEAQAYQDLPFERLVEALNPERTQSHSPIFQVLFGFDVAPAVSPTLAGAPLERLPVPGWEWARFDLSIILREQQDGSLRAQVEYATDLFEPSTIERLIGHYETLLAAAAVHPTRRLSEQDLLTPGEREELLIRRNSTSTTYERRCLHELFVEQAARTPEAVAVSSGSERISYRELDRRSNQLARLLNVLGVETGTFVGICLDRSIDLLVALLGVLKSGAAYVPIEPTYPPGRQEFMLADVQARVLLTQEQYADAVDPQGAKVVCVDRDLFDRQAADPLLLSHDPDQLAYVIYTSGSTGRPKGVEIRHRSVANLLSHMRVRPGLGPDDVVANLTTPAFDLSVPDWYLPLTTGARLAIVPREATLDAVELADWLARTGATFVQATPTTWQMLVDSGWRGSDSLKIVCGGEALSRGLAEALLVRGASLWHMYGPTETTVWSSALQLESGHGSTPLGGPISNTAFYVLDEWRRPVPVGVAGELYIGGDGVARGYYDRTELNAEKFVLNPFGEGNLFRTGDLVRWRESATLEFLGRIDQQVKVRGFRIELGEIEAVLTEHPEVAAAVALVREDVPGDQRLVAYVVPAAGRDIEINELRRVTRSELPEFMVPTRFVTLDAFPVTPNGKIDRAALPAPDWAGAAVTDAHLPPRTPVERLTAAIWQEVLGLDSVGIDDNFFDLGGHSLLAVKMLARLQGELGVSIPLRHLFDASTVRQVSEIVTAELLDGIAGDDAVRLLEEAESNDP
jgi:amino acid adenylation domain-containing protein